MKDEETLLISWDASITDTGAGASDGLMYFVYFPDLQFALTDVGGRKREEGQAAVYIPSHLPKQRLEVQIAFKSLLTNEVSTSQYARGIRFDPDFEMNRLTGEEKPLCKAMSVGKSLFKRT